MPSTYPYCCIQPLRTFTMENLQDPDETLSPRYECAGNPAAFPFQIEWQRPQPSLPGPHPSRPSLPGPHPSRPSLPGPHPSRPSLPGPHPSRPSLPGPHPSRPSLPGPPPSRPSLSGPLPSRPSFSTLRATAEPFVPNAPVNSHGMALGRSLPASGCSTTIAISSAETFYSTITRDGMHSGSTQAPMQPAQPQYSGLLKVPTASSGHDMNLPNDPGPQAFTHTSPQTYTMRPTRPSFSGPSPMNMGIPVQHWSSQSPSATPTVSYAPPQPFLPPHQTPVQENLRHFQYPPPLQHPPMPQRPSVPQHTPIFHHTQQPQYSPLTQHAPLRQHIPLPQNPQYAPQNSFGSRSVHFSAPQASMQPMQSMRPRVSPVYAPVHQGHPIVPDSRPYSFFPGPSSVSTHGASQLQPSEFIPTGLRPGYGGSRNLFNLNPPDPGPSDQPLMRMPVTHASAPPRSKAPKGKGKGKAVSYQQNVAQSCAIYSCTQSLPHVHIRTAVIEGPLPPHVRQNHPSIALRNPNMDNTRPQFAIGRLDADGDDWEVGGKILGSARTEPQRKEADSRTPRKFSFETERSERPMGAVRRNAQQSRAMARQMPPNPRQSSMWPGERPHTVDIRVDAERGLSSLVENANKKQEASKFPRNNFPKAKNEATGRSLAAPHRHHSQKSPFHPSNTGSCSNEPSPFPHEVSPMQGQIRGPISVQGENQNRSDGSYGYPSVIGDQKGGSASAATFHGQEISVGTQPRRLKRGPSQDDGEQQQQQRQHQESLSSWNQKKRRKATKDGKNGN